MTEIQPIGGVVFESEPIDSGGNRHHRLYTEDGVYYLPKELFVLPPPYIIQVPENCRLIRN